MLIFICILINFNLHIWNFLDLYRRRNCTFWLFENALDLRFLFLYFIFIFYNFWYVSAFYFFWRNFIHHFKKLVFIDGILYGNAFLVFLITYFKYALIWFWSRVYVLPFSIPYFLHLVKVIVFKKLRFLYRLVQLLLRLQRRLVFAIFTELKFLVKHLKKILVLILFLIYRLIFLDLRIHIRISSFTLQVN